MYCKLKPFSAHARRRVWAGATHINFLGLEINNLIPVGIFWQMNSGEYIVVWVKSSSLSRAVGRRRVSSHPLLANSPSPITPPQLRTSREGFICVAPESLGASHLAECCVLTADCFCCAECFFNPRINSPTACAARPLAAFFSMVCT